jgi:ElaB/YqjD/DUF883 family membrane-anchored ribosome-binding protein
MNANTDQLLNHLNRVVQDLEELAAAATGATAEGSATVTERIREALAGARTRIKELEEGLQQEAARAVKAADSYVREHTWTAIAVAAALAFLLGALTARRD